MQQENKTIFKGICERITARMNERGMNKLDLSRRSGVSYSTVWAITKSRARPRTEAVEALARVLRVDAEYLLTGEHEKPAASTAPMMVKEGLVYPLAGDPPKETVASLVRKMSEQLELPEHLLWDCVTQMIEKKRRGSSDAKSKAG